jgi:uncharacterized protein with PQ loop repeat
LDIFFFFLRLDILTTVHVIFRPIYIFMSSAFIGACGHIAPAAAIGVFLAPLPTLLEIRRERTMGDYPLLPYSSMVSNAFVWIVYGILQSEPKIWFPSIVGLVLGLLYFWNFVQYGPLKASTLPGSVTQHILGTVGLMVICLFAMITNCAAAVGIMGILLSVFMFGSPLSALRTVLKTKSAKASIGGQLLSLVCHRIVGYEGLCYLCPKFIGIIVRSGSSGIKNLIR